MIEDPIKKILVENNVQVIFSIYIGQPILINCRGYDYRSKDLPNMLHVLLNTYRKLAGIIYYHKKSENLKLKYYGKLNHELKHGCYETPAIYPEKILVPDLYELMNRQKFLNHDKTRFELLKWIIDSDKVTVADFNLIPKEFFVEILTLIYMRKNEIISIKEAEIFLVAIEQMKKFNDEQSIVHSRKYPENISSRAFNLVFVFKKITKHIFENICEVVGFEQFCNVSIKFELIDA